MPPIQLNVIPRCLLKLAKLGGSRCNCVRACRWAVHLVTSAWLLPELPPTPELASIDHATDRTRHTPENYLSRAAPTAASTAVRASSTSVVLVRPEHPGERANARVPHLSSPGPTGGAFSADDSQPLPHAEDPRTSSCGYPRPATDATTVATTTARPPQKTVLPMIALRRQGRKTTPVYAISASPCQ